MNSNVTHENKFELYEIVEITKDKKYTGMFEEQIGYISKIHTFDIDNGYKYDIDLIMC